MDAENSVFEWLKAKLPFGIEPRVQPLVKTYVLIGADQLSATVFYERREDVKQGHTILITAKPGQSFKEAVKQIKPPASITLMAHGTEDSTFMWNKGEFVPYDELLKSVPQQNIYAVAIDSCHGQLITFSLANAPPGSIVISSGAGFGAGINSRTVSVIQETAFVTDPIDLLLKAYDNFDPENYKKAIIQTNKRDGTDTPSDPMKGLPTLIGIGGKPPITIDLAGQADKIFSNSVFAKLPLKPEGFVAMDEEAWKRAVSRVQKAFDTKHYITDSNSNHKAQDLGKAAEIALDARIAQMAETMRTKGVFNGKDEVETADNLRIVYAITAAYLDESGQIAKWRQQQIARAVDLKLIAAMEANPETVATLAAREKIMHEASASKPSGSLPDAVSVSPVIVAASASENQRI